MRARTLALALALGVISAASCGGSSSPKTAASTTTTRKTSPAQSAPSTTIVGCQQVPPPGAPAFSWLPADLPMPPGSYAVSEAQVSSGKAGTMVVPLGLSDFVRFALSQYPTAGWRLGRGDAEPGEAEDNYVNGRRGGAWRVRSSYCDVTKSELFIVYIDNISQGALPQPSTTLGTTPHSTVAP